jgi:hypothetical protein
MAGAEPTTRVESVTFTVARNTAIIGLAGALADGVGLD